MPGVAHENYWFQRHRAAYRWVARSLPVRGAVVVEAGCGEGYGGQLLADAGAVLVVGLDLDLPSLRHAALTYPGVRPVRANLVSLPLADGCAGLVVEQPGRRAPVGPGPVRPRVRPGAATRRPAGRHHPQPA